MAGHVQHQADPRARVGPGAAGRTRVPVRPGPVLPLPVPQRKKAEMSRPEMRGKREPVRVRAVRQGGPDVRREELRAPLPPDPAVRAGEDVRRPAVHAAEDSRRPDDQTPQERAGQRDREKVLRQKTTFFDFLFFIVFFS